MGRNGDSPYQTVGRITVAQQPAWTQARSKAVDDGLSFSVWHGLGGVPARSVASTAPVSGPYEAGKTFRNAHGDDISEPREGVRLPG